MIASVAVMLLAWFLCWGCVCIGFVPAAKEKIVKKRPIAVSDPWSLRSLDDWINLGHSVLKKSCEAANLPSTGSITMLARRLLNFYQGISTSDQGKRVFILMSTQVFCFDWSFLLPW